MGVLREISIQGQIVPVDIRKELSVFEWKSAEWQHDKLQACSPFRDDSRPSFYVWLDDNPAFNARAGYWGDSGGDEYRSGSFVTLLAYLRQETEEETADYLLSKYSPDWEGDLSRVHKSIEAMFAGVITQNNRRQQRRQPLNPSILQRYNFRHPYLTSRGISEGVQRAMRVGYDPKRRMVTIPWFSARGDLVNVKYRSVNSKFFQYTPLKDGAHPVREHVYGIDVIRRKGCRGAVICEAEIDAMYAMTAGFPAVAVGCASFSKEKADIILRSPIRHLIVAADNDQAGRILRDEIIKRLNGYVRLSVVDIPAPYKDLNDVTEIDELKKIINSCYLFRPSPI